MCYLYATIKVLRCNYLKPKLRRWSSTIIAPKLAAESVEVSRLVQPFMGNTVEFQLRTYDACDDAMWRRVVDQYKLQDVILHAPFRQHNLEDVCLSKELRQRATEYILRQCEYAEHYGVNTYILYHITYPVESAVNLNFYAELDAFLEPIKNSERTKLLVENTIVSLDIGKRRIEEDPITEVLKATTADQVMMCFDLCHYLSSKNAVQEEYNFSPTWRNRIYSVHFSETRRNEGFKHFAVSHGRRHDSQMGVARDLCLLKDLGVDLDRVRIVAEISEADYILRPEEAQELAWLHKLNREGITF